MAKVMAAAVRNRQEVPDEPLEIRADAARLRLVATSTRDDSPREFAADSGRLRLTPRAIAQARERARRSRRPHNQARSVFAREIVNALTRQLTSRIGTDVRTGGSLMDQQDVTDLRRELRTDPAVRAAISALWPILTPQRLVGDLLSDPQRLAAAAPRMSAADRAALHRAAGRAVDAGRRTAAGRGSRAARRGRPSTSVLPRPGADGRRRRTPRACWTSSAVTTRTTRRS